MPVTPYLFFNGRCEEALDFYRNAIGAELSMMLRFSDCPEPLDPNMVPPGSEQRIMHASFMVGDTMLSASDGCPGQPSKFDGFALSLQAGSPAEAERLFAAFGEGGQVRMPLSKTFFSPSFGMVADKFGVCWMVNVEQAMK